MTLGAVLRTPKLRPADECRRWYRFYAMFSEAFARDVIERTTLASGAVLYDPWLGVGTSTAVAGSLGIQALGVDINPVMVTIARGRLASREIANEAATAARDFVASSSIAVAEDDPLHAWFGNGVASELRQWQFAAEKVRSTMSSLEGADFLLTCIFSVAHGLAGRFQTKNPTWVRRPAPADRIDSSPKPLSELIDAEIVRRSEFCTDSASNETVCLKVGSSADQNCDPESIDLVLSSPPYCTRIDYAVTTQIELAVLGDSESSLRELRDRSMGTSTIRRKRLAQRCSEWGPTCLSFVQKVQEHPSKASAGYYLKTYEQYFGDLSGSIDQLAKALRRGGIGVLVVQDSYYKGVHTDLARIVNEMSELAGLNLTARDDFPAKKSMRNINTRSRRYRMDTSGTESVLWFTKP